MVLYCSNCTAETAVDQSDIVPLSLRQDRGTINSLTISQDDMLIIQSFPAVIDVTMKSDDLIPLAHLCSDNLHISDRRGPLNPHSKTHTPMASPRCSTAFVKLSGTCVQ